MRYVEIENGQGNAPVGATGGGSSPVRVGDVGNLDIPVEYIAFSARGGSWA